MAIETRCEHIVRTESGVPVISGTGFKVELIVLDHLVYGWSPEAIQIQHPQLGMSQIHSALAFYWDNKAEMDAEIERGEQYAEAMRLSAPSNPLVERLRATKRARAG